jgi:hypothetical protein
LESWFQLLLAVAVAVLWACADAATSENITAQAASTLACDAGREEFGNGDMAIAPESQEGRRPLAHGGWKHWPGGQQALESM